MAGVVIESTVICEYVDDQWPDQPLKPKDSFGRAQMRLSAKQLDVGLQPVPTIRRRADAARTAILFVELWLNLDRPFTFARPIGNEMVQAETGHRNIGSHG